MCKGYVVAVWLPWRLTFTMRVLSLMAGRMNWLMIAARSYDN